jgi:ketosteroid isomerase-like protein
MIPKLPHVIELYIEGKNAYDVEATLACFSEDAVVHDEGKDHRGKPKIKSWIEETIRKYQDQLRPLRAIEQDGELVLTAEISGTFDGSPIELDLHFTVESNKIAALSIG